MLCKKYQPVVTPEPPPLPQPLFYWNDYNLGGGKDAYGMNKLESLNLCPIFNSTLLNSIRVVLEIKWLTFKVPSSLVGKWLFLIKQPLSIVVLGRRWSRNDPAPKSSLPALWTSGMEEFGKPAWGLEPREGDHPLTKSFEKLVLDFYGTGGKSR